MDTDAQARQGAPSRRIRAGEEALLAAALRTIQELNERGLLALKELARTQPVRLPRYLQEIGPTLKRLDEGAIGQVAHQPFLLMDFAFSRPAVLRELLVRSPARLRFPAPAGLLPTAEAIALSRGALLLAQSVCRYHPAHGRLLLGLDPSLHEAIAQLRLPDLERVAEENPHLLRLRWDENGEFWRVLLSCWGAAYANTHYQARMYGLQLIAGESRLQARGR